MDHSLFDTSVTQVSNNRYIWKSPNHGTYTFNKASKADKGFEETYILNTTGKWKLNVARNEIIINNTNDPKNLFKFKDGRLLSFCGGKDSDTFRLSYTNGFPNVVYNLTKSVEELRFEYNSERFLTRILFPRDKKSLFISYSPCNTYAPDGTTKQGKLYKSISSITFVDGNREEYKYSAEAGKKRAYLTKNNKEGETKVPTNKLTQVRSGNESGFISWDATTGIIISDSGGEYSVRNPLIDKFSPEYDAYEIYRKRSSRTQESRISYKKPEYKYAEIWDYSSRNAVKITQDPNTGEQTRTAYIGNPGNASMKVRKIEKKSPNTNNWIPTLSYVYDDKGNPIRILYSNGNIDSFKYQGHIPIKAFRNGALLWEQVLKDGSISEKYEYTPSGKIILRYSNRLLQSIELNGESLLERNYSKDGHLIKEVMPGLKIEEVQYSSSGNLTKNTLFSDGTSYTTLYDKHGAIISTAKNDEPSISHQNITSTYRSDSERDFKIADIYKRINTEYITPTEHANMLIDIAKMYYGNGIWKDDIPTAIQIYEKLLIEFPLEFSAIAQAYTNLAAIYMELQGVKNRHIALNYLTKLYAINTATIPNMHKNMVENEQNGAFFAFLSLHESGDYYTDIEIINELGKKYAHSKEQWKIIKKRLNYLDSIRRETLTK